MSAHDELVSLIKDDYQKKGEEITDDEAAEAARNLVRLFDLLAQSAWKDMLRHKRLKREPDGFPVDSQYSCLVCGRSINETNGWYHWGGQRCLICHKAIVDGVVPQFVLQAHDSYYRMWKLKDFGVTSQAARKMVKEGRLTARVILSENGRPYEYIFLKKENPELVACERFNPIRKSHKRHQEKRTWEHEQHEVSSTPTNC